MGHVHILTHVHLIKAIRNNTSHEVIARGLISRQSIGLILKQTQKQAQRNQRAPGYPYPHALKSVIRVVEHIHSQSQVPPSNASAKQSVFPDGLHFKVGPALGATDAPALALSAAGRFALVFAIANASFKLGLSLGSIGGRL